MRILNFGSCNIDYVYALDHIVGIGETQTTQDMQLFPGGKGLNQSIALARAGAEVWHAGCIGSDGEMLRLLLAESGVNTDHLTSVDVKNGHAVIQVSATGENSIFLYPGSNAAVTPAQIDDVLQHFAAGDILLLQNEISHIPYLVRRAYERGMRIILNPSPFNEGLAKIDLGMLSYVILNEVEAKQISGYEEPEGALAWFAARYPGLCVMLTLGSRGCIYRDKNGELYHPSFAVKATDTTAAGDTFTGYFVAGVARGDELFGVLRLATAAAAISVTRSGAATSIPTLAEVQALLPQLQQRSEGKNKRAAEQIRAYLSQNLQNATVGGLAHTLGYSEGYTRKLVKSVFDLSFSALLRDMRCEAAARLLRETDLPISKIINDVGYSNETFFRKIFQQKYGVNPLKFKHSKESAI